MPCGGIRPVLVKDETSYLPGAQKWCFQCREVWNEEAEYVYFCDEWDCWICRECIHEFLQTEEGKIVIRHKHEILIEEGG